MTTAMTDELISFDQRAVIKVCGVGGGGGNAVARMIEGGLKDVDFITINTDSQALKKSPAGTRLQIGSDITDGLGSGAKPEIGLNAANDDRERITEVLRGAHMVFVTAGLGGGTGTGAAPIVAEVARSSGALTVGIITLPFGFEGIERTQTAMKGLEALEEHVDTLIVIPNDRLARICQSNMSLLDAFRHADEVLHNGVRAISELITVPGLINLDFADVRTIMQARGRALMGIGAAEGEGRAIRAAEEAIVCPLLEQSNIHGAKGVIVNIRGGADIGMREVQDAVTTVQQAAHADANIIFGAVIDDEERAEMQVTVIAAGFEAGVPDEFLNAEELEIAAPTLKGSVKEEHQVETSEPQGEKVRVGAGQAPAEAQPTAEEILREPDIEFLFPPEDAGPVEPLAKVEPDEDLSIPAFMRNRKRKF